MRSFCLFLFQVIWIDFLHHNLGPRPRIDLHLQPLILINLNKGIPRDIQLLKRGEIPRTNQIMLVLDHVVTEIEFNQGRKVSSDQAFCVDAADLVTGD